MTKEKITSNKIINHLNNSNNNLSYLGKNTNKEEIEQKPYKKTEIMIKRINNQSQRELASHWTEIH